MFGEFKAHVVMATWRSKLCFMSPQKSLGRGGGTQQNKKYTNFICLHKYQLAGSLPQLHRSFAKFLNKAAKSRQNWLTFTPRCRNFEDLKQVSSGFVSPALLKVHFVVTFGDVDFMTETLSGLILLLLKVAGIPTDLSDQRKIGGVSEPEQPENNTFFSNI